MKKKKKRTNYSSKVKNKKCCLSTVADFHMLCFSVMLHEL